MNVIPDDGIVSAGCVRSSDGEEHLVVESLHQHLGNLPSFFTAGQVSGPTSSYERCPRIRVRFLITKFGDDASTTLSKRIDKYFNRCCRGTDDVDYKNILLTIIIIIIITGS